MTRRHILITGGAGFIGSHLADALLVRGHRVRALDALIPQVHGESRARPAYLSDELELMVGDVRDPDAVRRALVGVDVVVHFAARVGVGQSMYELEEYVDTNNRGTAVLLEAIAKKPVGRLLVASSMSIYGEGLYRSPSGLSHDVIRTAEALERRQWEPLSLAGEALEALPTPETKQPAIASLYALSKYDQERMCLLLGHAYGVPTTALRFFNVYGTRQSLSNPYTGVLAIFASRLLNDKRPLIFEDGLQTRDFTHVDDIVQACMRALEVDGAAGQVLNVGSGRATSVMQIAHGMARATQRAQLEPVVTQQYRTGDIRHCYADIGAAQRVLGYSPEIRLERGLEELTEWLASEVAVDRVEHAYGQLQSRGLLV